MLRFPIFLGALCALTVLCPVPSAHAADVAIDTAKVEQIHRLEPLSPDKVDIFVQAGQLTDEQADFVKLHIDEQGRFVPPAAAAPAPAPRAPVEPPPPPAPEPRAPLPPPEPPRPAVRAPAPPPPPPSVGPRDVYTEFHYQLPIADQEHLRGLIRDFKHGDHSAIGRELRKFRPQVNQLIAQAYNDPIDMLTKVDLWEEVAGPANADACVGMFETHRAIYETGRLVLIPYEKDVGGVEVRRRIIGAEGGDGARERFFTSREIRDAIEKLEGLISRCSGVPAATFLMDVYAKRYDAGEAPMRDSKRDRHRLVEACGGNVKKFDEDEPKTWGSSLSQHDRALIAEALIPYLHRENSDRRQIAKNGLEICVPRGHPHWDEGHGAWERWWDANKAALLSER